MQRYFIETTKATRFPLKKEDSYHILTVMRMQIGDHLEVVVEHTPYLCRIDAVVDQNVWVVEEQKLVAPRPFESKIALAQALVKEEKMDFILQKATELGVDEIVPYQAARSVCKINGKEEKRRTRWQRIVKEASEQSKRVTIPEVTAVLDIDKLCKLEYDIKILCTVNELSTNIKSVLQNTTNSATMIIVIGPEGGFQEEEEEKLKQAGFLATSLGERVLRTETAGLYVMSILNYYYMR